MGVGFRTVSKLKLRVWMGTGCQTYHSNNNIYSFRDSKAVT